MRRCLIWVVPLLIASAPAAAQTVTAVCKGLSGRAMGVESSGALVNEVDGMRGGQIAITWKTGAKTAQIVAQGFGGVPVTDTGSLVHVSAEQASFVVNYPAAVWLYSLFVRPKHLLVTRHTSGVADAKGGAIGNVLHASCEIRAK